MLKLKRVEIHGFKSFYDRTEMKFSGSGIAAVVGPNGCGKSNLSDALSWVLGEQSAKSLRGARMEDVIFAGTRDKKALGMASVTMTLVPDETTVASAKSIAQSTVPEENPTNNIDVRPEAEDSPSSENPAEVAAESIGHAKQRQGEITITRRLYRSGDSEYLINGKQARLRDIQDLFLGTGLGPESYAIIEQGRIGQILSNKPQDRRNVIEEAAGITKFKTRKRLAEAKLESAKQNLSRVFDILEEVTRQANSLKRQAAKTKRYGELRDEATDCLRLLLSAKFRILERDMAKVAIELNLATAEWQKAQTAIQEQESEQEKVLAASYETEGRLTEARKQLADLKLEAERARGRFEYQTKQVDQISQATSAGQGELQALENQQAERTAELEGQAAELEQLEYSLAVAQEELGVKAAERQAAASSLTEAERGLEAKRQNVLRLLGESASLRNRITQIEAQLASSDRDVNRARNEEEQSQADLARIQELKTKLSEQLAARQTDLISVEEQLKTVEGELQQKKVRLGESRGTLDGLKSEASRMKARKDSLEEIIQHRSYTTETVKRLFTAVERGKAESFQPVGVLADFVEVDPQFEKAAEEFLHDELEYVVVNNWSEGERGIELIRGDLDGRGTFLVERAGEARAEATEVPQPQSGEGALTRLSDALRWTNGLSEIPIAQLPRIANCYVTGERALARELATQFPHCWFLTPDGVNYHGQAISGGKKSGAGPLALKRELRDLLKAEAAKQAELQESQEQLVELERVIANLSEELDQLRGQRQAQEKDVLALDHESRKLGEEWGRVQARLSHARLELDRIARDRVKLEENLAADRGNLEARESTRAAEEEALAEAREQLVGLQNALAHATEEHASRRADLAGIEERRRSVAGTRGRLENQVRDLTNRRAHLASEMERMQGEKAQLLASNAELRTKADELAIAMSETETGVNQLAVQEGELRNGLAAAEERLRATRALAQQVQEQRSERQVELARAEAELKHLEETCAQELNTTLKELADRSEELQPNLAIEELEGKHADVRRKIENLGPVNPTALEEFEQAQQRQEFLSAQRQDLLDSIRDTEKAIHEIDDESRKRFGEAFQAINENFREMFRTLFGGGIGEMRLTDEENLADSGIDIVASPPGKRLQSVLLLSGGEKSLTAMALLMAIFQYTPSPFCILDEVDAPLDEPNIERLTHLLRDMSEDTQFIVITHAKRTMEAAQSLYGVTMQEPGVSKLVSVRFKSPVDGEPSRGRREPRLAVAGV
ncbi:MAG TPA: chromosome segregation protein SMC [Bryobacteraceae bacterium]|nr:chromosome segregation protein SMC [Bryobacteraceae bacterium]